MPSRKIFATIIVCASVTVAVWLIARTPTGVQKATDDTGVVVVREKIATNPDDWKKLLSTTDSNEKITSVVPKSNPNAFDDTTLTAQLAKDFFAQYLTVANKGPISDGDVNTIVENVLASPGYTNVSGAVYINSNLNIVPDSQPAIQTYFDSLNTSIENRVPKNNDDLMAILKQAMETKNEKLLDKFDPYISAGKLFIRDLLTMPVPHSASGAHLSLLNASSNLLASLEAMRATFSDPVKSFAGASKYSQYLTDVTSSLQNLGTYFQQNLKK